MDNLNKTLTRNKSKCSLQQADIKLKNTNVEVKTPTNSFLISKCMSPSMSSTLMKIRTPKRICHQIVPPQTPECYNTVTFETPRKESSKNKAGKMTKLNVAVRIRPMNSQELSTHGTTNILSITDTDITVKINSLSDPISEFKHCFQYDHVLQSFENNDMVNDQQKVYEIVARPLLNEAFEGYNACLFAYGQTGSGKSYSMMGINSVFSEVSLVDNNEAGIIPRFCHELFSRLQNLDSSITTTVEVSYFEIYNEKIHDLLASSVNGPSKRTPLKVREHPVLGPYVVDLSIHPVNSSNAINSWIIAGNKQRATASTLMNDKSSRSHSIFSVILSISAPNDKQNIISRQSKVNLVDLAGSERIGNLFNNDERLREGVSINRSLLTLGKVIAALSEQKRTNHIPYRESVLTWLLRESLGGNSRTCMLATITPASCHVEETLSTLRYASQARTIVNRIRVNEDPHDRLIKELRAEVKRLRALRQDYEKCSLNNITVQESDESELKILDIKHNKKDDTELFNEECKIINDNGQVNIILKNHCTSLEHFILKENEDIIIKGQFTITKKLNNSDNTSLNKNIFTNSLDTSYNNELTNLDNSVIVAEQYRNELDLKMKICSTPDSPNDISSFHTNFLEELQNILTSSKSPQIQNSSRKCPSLYKQNSKSTLSNREEIEKCIQDLKKSHITMSNLITSDQMLNALMCLNDAICKVDRIFKAKKGQKSVKFR